MKKLLEWAPFILVNLFFLGILAGAKYGEVTFFFQAYMGILIAMSAGFLGATFSMLIQNQRRVSEGSLEDLTAASSWYALIVRGSVGLGAAVILYFFFESGLLEGSLWPDLENLSFNGVKSLHGAHVPNANWCLLVIWCFLAGFSETLVPSILQKTEQKGSAA